MAPRALGALLALALALAGAATAGAQEPRASLPDLEDELMCPICGTTLELSSSPQAERQRELIRRLIDRGRSKEEIKDAMVAEYGPDVLAVPEAEGFDLAAWLVPAIGLLLAAGAVALAMARISRRRRPPAAPEQQLDEAERRRLERDMSSYEL